MKSYKNISSHPFLQKIIDCRNKPGRQLDQNSTCDEIFSDYVIKMANYCNPQYFIQLLKFITLFREFANISKKDLISNETQEFTELINAEDLPDLSNDFITEFLEQNQFNIGKSDSIDLTQNFCNWLYDNNFSSSRLTLINNHAY